MGVHDLLKLYKHGYSKVTDHASREVRFGRLTREQGMALVRAHERQPARYGDLFAQWLGATPRSLEFMYNQHRNPAFWQQTRPGSWTFNGWSARQDPTEQPDGLPRLFEANSSLARGRDAQYITIGKGWP
jgi:hypothetical protein